MNTIFELKSKQKVVIFGGDYCPYCVRVKSLFEKKQVPFEYRDITQKQFEAERDKLSKALNWQTVPMVFINNKFYGGCTDIEELDKKGDLQKLLQ